MDVLAEHGTEDESNACEAIDEAEANFRNPNGDLSFTDLVGSSLCLDRHCVGHEHQGAFVVETNGLHQARRLLVDVHAVHTVAA